MNKSMFVGMPAGAQIINTAGGKQVYAVVTTGSAIRSMLLSLVTVSAH